MPRHVTRSEAARKKPISIRHPGGIVELRKGRNVVLHDLGQVPVQVSTAPTEAPVPRVALLGSDARQIILRSSHRSRVHVFFA